MGKCDVNDGPFRILWGQPMTDKYNPFISDAVQAVHKAVESTNKNLDNALTVAVEALTYMRNNCLEYAADYMDKADEALQRIAAILKVRQKD